jgi:hypothetical protein
MLPPKKLGPLVTPNYGLPLENYTFFMKNFKKVLKKEKIKIFNLVKNKYAFIFISNGACRFLKILLFFLKKLKKNFFFP